MNGADDRRKCSPRDMICDEEIDEGEVEAELEEGASRLNESQVLDEDAAVMDMIRQQAEIWGGAGPAAGKQPMWGMDEELDQDVRDECPDLAEYFGQYLGLEEVSQIAMCRTYANYLASKQRQARPPTKRQKK